LLNYQAIKKEKIIIPNGRWAAVYGKRFQNKGTFNVIKLIIFVTGNIETMKTAYQEEVLTDVLEAVETTDLMDLIVFNDDVNTFDHVINTLIRVCKHTQEQAEQCTMLIHYKGKCAVKNGSFDYLKPMREAICEAGIDARII
jgi:ATP-dependent Clp protease adaptor protein ClpS